VGVATAALVAATLGCAVDVPAGPPDHLDDVPEWLAREAVRIGSVDDPTIGFWHVADVQIDADGRSSRSTATSGRSGSSIRRVAIYAASAGPAMARAS
jgi:hypothetical protein